MWIEVRGKMDKFNNKTENGNEVEKFHENYIEGRNAVLEAYKNIPKEEYKNILFVSDELSDDIIGSMAFGTKTAWICKNTVNSWRKSEPEIFKTDYKIESVSELKSLL